MTDRDTDPGSEPDPDKLALLEAGAAALADAAHEFGVSAGMADPPPPWADLGRLERNLRLAGLIALARRHRTLLVELAAIYAPGEDE